MDGLCALCGVEEPASRHHLIPRCVHTNKWFKKRFSRQEMLRTILICMQCHDMINALDPKEIGRNFNTPELLAEHPALVSYLSWKRRKR
jgi:hypothetical protein